MQPAKSTRSSCCSLLGCEPTSSSSPGRGERGPGKRVVDRTLLRNGLSGKELRDAIRTICGMRSQTALVSIQWVNSETGVVQPVEEFGRVCSEAGVPFHTDAAQAVGKLPVNLRDLPVDFASIAGHKFHAPPGTGALVSARQPRAQGAPGRRRSGVGPAGRHRERPGIAGMGCASGLRAGSLPETIIRLGNLRDLFESEVMDRCAGVSAKRWACHPSVQHDQPAPSTAWTDRPWLPGWTSAGSGVRKARHAPTTGPSPRTCCGQWDCRKRRRTQASASACRC